VVITTTLINIFNVVWFARNQARFNDKIVTGRSSVSVISSNSNMAGNLTSKKASSSMYDFTILKKFNVNIHPPNAPKIIKVLWHPPILNWVKCNTDGSATSSSLACGGIFRNNNAQFMLCFSENTGNGNTFFAELSGAMRAIELASQHRWTKLWLECDSAMVVNAFKNNTIVPWKIRNRWENCLALCKSMQLLVTRVYREGNSCADTLANLGLTIDHLTIWTDLPLCRRRHFVKNRLAMPTYRFSYP